MLEDLEVHQIAALEILNARLMCRLDDQTWTIRHIPLKPGDVAADGGPHIRDRHLYPRGGRKGAAQKIAFGRSISGLTRITPTSIRLKMDAGYGSKLARTLGLIQSHSRPMKRSPQQILRLDADPGGEPKTWRRPSRPSSIGYPRSASGPYPGGCSTCRASLVAGDWGGASTSMLP
jgi:hypothetical protein